MSEKDHDHIHALVIINKRCDISDANLRQKDHSFNYKIGRIYNTEENLHMAYLRKES